ncbi:uncharacterized protein LOC120011888 isoform X2 [Tripterygium wilfordii]|uniref:uncharacterized protein LOC120011888 isoform X2 n=1 Tax=Tripterygium wilfordii TaxID=458696 RepID=UPI0018F83B84|nr:uncharacterized protein LOC120011888 isoform X2 [Tripterygium wilfordii]
MFSPFFCSMKVCYFTQYISREDQMKLPFANTKFVALLIILTFLLTSVIAKGGGGGGGHGHRRREGGGRTRSTCPACAILPGGGRHGRSASTASHPLLISSMCLRSLVLLLHAILHI